MTSRARSGSQRAWLADAEARSTPQAPGAPPTSADNAEAGSDRSAAGRDRARRRLTQLMSTIVTRITRWLEAYAQIAFGRSRVAGLLFLAATFVVPAHGAAGLFGLVICNGFAHLLGRPRAHIEEGYYGFNGLLVGLALGLFFRFSPTFVVLLLVVSLLTVVLAAAMRNIAERYLGLPVLSLPFVLATWIALLATRRFAEVEVALDPVLVSDLGAGVLPGWADLYVRSLGACFFQLSTLSGLFVLAGLLFLSRWATLLSIVGFASGCAIYLGLGGAQGDLDNHFVGFNFILSSIAVGGIFVVLSPGSLALAAAAGALSAIISAAILALLGPMHLPVLAFPFILATQLLVFALMLRTRAGGLQLVSGMPDTPEANLTRANFEARRYPDPSTPLVDLPVMGRWKVTQGHDGPHTHQGLWAHAWDLEVVDDDGRTFRDEGHAIEEYYAYRAPVCAPAAGKVVRVIAHHEDNPVGEVDTVNNWGNVIVLWHHGQLYSALCHLQKGSVRVHEGDAVVRGQVLARVGNSGRSPVPHLHFQLQATAEVGAPTLKGQLLHYVQQSADADGAPIYVTCGIPEEGAIVRPLTVDEAVRRALTLAPGLEREWEVRGAGVDGTVIETWRSEIDAVGGRRLVSDADAVARLYADDRYLTVLDYEGPRDTLLGLLYLGTPRVPYLGEDGIVWNDSPATGAFVGTVARLGQELVRPFVEVGAVATTSRLERTAGGAMVATTLAVGDVLGGRGELPDRIEIVWEPGLGPTRIAAWRGDTLMVEAATRR